MAAPDSQTQGCAWENRSELGLVNAYWVTLKQCLIETRDFAAGCRGSADYWSPVLFALISVVIGLAGTQLWAELKDWAIGDIKNPYALRMKMIVYNMTLLPLVCKAGSAILIQSILEVVVSHWTMKRLSPQHYTGLRATWSVYFYALGATTVLGVLPFVGNAFAVVWRPIVLALGFAEAHRVPMYVAIAGVLAIAATGEIVKIAISTLSLFLGMGDALSWGDILRFLLGTM